MGNVSCEPNKGREADADAEAANRQRAFPSLQAGRAVRRAVRSSSVHDRPLTFAAIAASHHQMVGNADMPYSGSFSGLPKRSQRAVRSFP